MVKYFSVDWLAQSYHNPALTEDRGGAMNNAPTCRPHIPCMVQPRPPTYGKGYLQPKLKPSKPVAHTDPVESSGSQDCSLLHPTSCASPISEMSEYSSGYESETASSDCLSLDEESKVEEEAPKRRVRTKFTPEQINKLEKIFSRHKYLEAGKRLKTAQKLNLTETQVRSWFQNRRMKLKRELQDYLAPQLPAVMFQPLAPFQYHSIAGHPTHYPSAGPAFCPPLHIPQMVLQQNMAHQNPPHLMLYNQHFY
ncbi:Homeobox protein vent1 [Channa argus]|uniref:Homeobox protein vent1 n=1 Tax=Channa argus TaxID=215402 RepID=A0A6G1R291_CHAAH|nr:Homeobox protein vent1 [Channa argus]KAK2922252.1 hypothetical protein Q8A73_001737 [Channa argus]